jgi:uncharacterized protein (TIGR02996 family)
MSPDFLPLWNALLAAPADNGLKLICADWLADHDADLELEAGLRLAAYHGVFPHLTTTGSWQPDFPWRWGTSPQPHGYTWPDSAIPPSHLLSALMDSDNGLGRGHNRTVHHEPVQLVRWLAWAAAECQKSQESVGTLSSTP